MKDLIIDDFYMISRAAKKTRKQDKKKPKEKEEGKKPKN